ncbi:hypothetical protein [Thermasporomyces composti]|nr:hypothetical protein [Thermasporomyces composti]
MTYSAAGTALIRTGIECVGLVPARSVCTWYAIAASVAEVAWICQVR